MGVYGFFAFMRLARLEKLSCCTVLRRLEAMLLPIDPKATGEMGLELEAPRPRPSRSSSFASTVKSGEKSREFGVFGYSQLAMVWMGVTKRMEDGAIVRLVG
jgi:hypothetical protein